MLRAAAATRTLGSRIAMSSTSSSAASQARSLATAPIGNPLAAEKYSNGREAALKWAKENGYSEECLVELPVQWGEQGQSRLVFLPRSENQAILTRVPLHALQKTPTHMSSEPALPVPRRFRLVPELTLFCPPRPTFPFFASTFSSSSARSAHCSNAVYFRWLETGRLNFMRVLGSHLQNEQAAKDLSGSGKGKGVILARITFDYRVSLPELSLHPGKQSAKRSDTCRTTPPQRPVMQPDNVLIAHKPVEVAARKLVLHGTVYSYSCVPHN